MDVDFWFSKTKQILKEYQPLYLKVLHWGWLWNLITS